MPSHQQYHDGLAVSLVWPSSRRLLRIGKLPRELRDELGPEGVICLAGYVGSLVFTSQRAVECAQPGRPDPEGTGVATGPIDPLSHPGRAGLSARRFAVTALNAYATRVD